MENTEHVSSSLSKSIAGLCPRVALLYKLARQSNGSLSKLQDSFVLTYAKD